MNARASAVHELCTVYKPHSARRDKKKKGSHKPRRTYICRCIVHVGRHCARPNNRLHRSFFLVHVRVVMAVLVNASIYDSTCSKTLVPWTVHCVEDERLTFGVFFETLVDRSDETTQAHLSDQRLWSIIV